MTTTSPQPPCTCRPYPAGHHGIPLHADQVDDLAALLTTTEHWLLNATSDVHRSLHQFLTTTRPDPTRQLLLDQVEDLIYRLTTTSQHWPHHADDSSHDLDPYPTTTYPPDPVDQYLEQLAATAALITHAGHDPRLAWTPC